MKTACWVTLPERGCLVPLGKRHLLRGTYCAAPTARHLLRGTYCAAPTARHLLRGTYCAAPTARHLLRGTYCAAPTARHRPRPAPTRPCPVAPPVRCRRR